MKTPSPMGEMTAALAALIDDELHAFCPEESMARTLYVWNDGEASTMTSCRFEDGLLVLSIDTPKGKRELALKPWLWSKPR